MKTFYITVKRVTYISYNIDADSQEDAEQQAIAEAESDYGKSADYSVEEVPDVL